MSRTARFLFAPVEESQSSRDFLPFLPTGLISRNQQAVVVRALVDTGATVNVLPFEIGQRLGLNWDELRISLELAGNLAQYEARAVVVAAKIEGFEPVNLTFAWTRSPNAPLILGQMNFFLEFNVCFFRTESAFELSKP
jgi:predicted aspartyl protease